ncbi:MAG: sigma-70 family RNA polymerase sigma factor [Gemmatimonadetes bacterium]|nr:sigma-70 family RNA polymerase sigma factor [Gemmatimonadota bacterium]
MSLDTDAAHRATVDRAIDAVWRIESSRLIAGLTRHTGDVALAEDLAQDALLAALQQWPASGIPHNPGAWLMTAARRRAIDVRRRAPMLERTHARLGAEADAQADDPVHALHDALEDPVGDERLGLMLMTCHPVLSREARVALTLRLLGGLTTDEIARAYLVPEATVAQRIVRAKRTLTAAQVPFEVPRGAALAERLQMALEVLYLVFNEGYAATAGETWMRADLCDEAMRLGRVVAALAPDNAEVHGLVALMELQASRLRARVGKDGAPVLLLDQNRARWDWTLIAHGLAALRRAEQLAHRAGAALGPYTMQAAIAACHARARVAADTDWVRIAALYDALYEAVPGPVVALNRAVAVGMAYGAAAGLAAVDALMADAHDGAALRDYHLLPSVRGDLLAKLGRGDEARAEFLRAARLTRNARERAVLLGRAEAL